ncbi:MAG TPA: RHS repeat-associated core domain-containing protein [Gammaproteobacteria bacterium]|nr:RHS repeat-associated core domain-containing protein [Gammaproteobacteria bacterium]
MLLACWIYWVCAKEASGQSDPPTVDGLYYYRARYYSPTYGRFIGEDPIGLIGGINRYVYASEDPIFYDDPNGLYCWSNAKILAVAGAAGGALAGAAATSEGTPLAMLGGAVVGAIGGGIAGYFTTDTGASNAAMGAVAGATSNGSNPGPGGEGGFVGGIATYVIQHLGAPAAVAVPTGGAIAGVVSEAAALGSEYAKAGSIGAAAGAVTVAVAAALSAGNNCPCQH